MGKKKTKEQAIELANLSKQLTVFISANVNGICIGDGIKVISAATARILHEYVMTIVDDEDEVDEYLYYFDELKERYANTLMSFIDELFIFAAKENLKKQKHGNEKGV